MTSVMHQRERGQTTDATLQAYKRGMAAETLHYYCISWLCHAVRTGRTAEDRSRCPTAAGGGEFRREIFTTA